nr:unnamed protein product [Callosobruchus analis]
MSYVFHHIPVYFIYYIHILAIVNFHFLVKLLSTRIVFLRTLLQDSWKLEASTIVSTSSFCLSDVYSTYL